MDLGLGKNENVGFAGAQALAGVLRELEQLKRLRRLRVDLRGSARGASARRHSRTTSSAEAHVPK